MKMKIIGKDVKATDAIKSYVEKKLERIEKYFDEEVTVNVTIKTQKAEQIAEMSVRVNTDNYRAVTSHKDLYASIDKDIDILEGQIRKIKTKKDKANKDTLIKEKILNRDLQSVSIENEVIKTIYYDVKPITIEDAILKLSEKPFDKFITFLNVETNKVNVLYKLKGGKNFGLIEPEA